MVPPFPPISRQRIILMQKENLIGSYNERVRNAREEFDLEK
jgi:ribosome-binding protein aMBF1 (putative translation factor)